MSEKCPTCGAPLENGTCGYCGYQEKPAAPSPSFNTPQAGQPYVQPQIVINNQTVQSQPVYSQNIVPGISRKSKMVALLLCIFLGGLGIHRFYVGKVGTGILYLLTGGLFGIGWIVDIIMIAIGAFKDHFDLPLRQ